MFLKAGTVKRGRAWHGRGTSTAEGLGGEMSRGWAAGNSLRAQRKGGPGDRPRGSAQNALPLSTAPRFQASGVPQSLGDALLWGQKRGKGGARVCSQEGECGVEVLK